MPSRALPACGLYRTLTAIGGVPANLLVYFHNHGDPGPGVYVPERWTHNRAHFSARGTTVPETFDGSELQALPREGFYRVTASFVCCARRCVTFAPDALVQLGYNGAGRALLFSPELTGGALTVPTAGTIVDDAMLANLALLGVREREPANELEPFPRGVLVH